MEQVQFDSVMALVERFGMWIFFASLFLIERKAHAETRKLWLDDLRDIAGLKASLRRDTSLNGDRPVTEGKKPFNYPVET